MCGSFTACLVPFGPENNEGNSTAYIEGDYDVKHVCKQGVNHGSVPLSLLGESLMFKWLSSNQYSTQYYLVLQ